MDDFNNVPVIIHKKETPDVFHQYVAAITCSMLAMMYGHSVGWSSAAVLQLQDGILPEGPVSQSNIGWVGGALCLGALVSSPFHGLLADVKGRKFASYLVALSFLVNWIIMYTAQNLWSVLIARFFAGIGAAGSITVVSIYNNEIAEPRLKSTLGSLMTLVYTSGILCGYMLGAWVSYDYVILIYLCVSLIFLPVWWFMPESPAYLVLNGNDKEALLVLEWLLGPQGGFAESSFERLKMEQGGAVKTVSIKEFCQNPAARKATFYANVMLVVQCFSGVFAFHSYAGGIFSRAGDGISPSTGTLLYGSLLVAGGMVPPLIADRIPRKVLLCTSCAVLGIALAILGGFLYLQSRGMIVAEPGSIVGLIPALALSTGAFFYYTGMGSIIYVAIMELFTDETRGVAGAICAITIWSTAFILLQFFGVAVEEFGDHTVFFFFSAVSIFGMLFICVFVPETRGKSVEEMAAILGNRK